jgi:hypothetical protein
MTITIHEAPNGSKLEEVAEQFHTTIKGSSSLAAVEQVAVLQLTAAEINAYVDHKVLDEKHRVPPPKPSDFLTATEIQKARKIYREAEAGTFASRCAKEIIEPVLERINKAFGQENDARYLAYLVEYSFNQDMR